MDKKIAQAISYQHRSSINLFELFIIKATMLFFVCLYGISSKVFLERHSFYFALVHFFENEEKLFIP